MARLKHSEINYLGAPSKPTDFAHARGSRGGIVQRYVRGHAANAYVAVADLGPEDELLQILNLPSSQPAASGADEPSDIKGQFDLIPMFELDRIELTEAGAEYTAAPTVTIAVATGTAEVTAATVTVALDLVDTDAVGIFTYTARGIFTGPVTVTFAAPTGGVAADRVTATGIVHLRPIDARIQSGTSHSSRRLAVTYRQDR